MAPTSRSGCSTAAATSRRHSRSRRGRGRTRTAIRRAPGEFSASCSGTRSSRTSGRAAFPRWPARSSPTRTTRSTTSSSRRCGRAEKVIVAAGGTVDASGLTIPVQVPEPPPLQQWDMGIPDAIVPASDAAWQWTGAWMPLPDRDGRPQAGRTTDAAGASATLSFTGTALALLGEFSQDGGRATVFLDGEPARPIDAWIPERTHDDALWHVYRVEARRAHAADRGGSRRGPAIDRPRDSTAVSGRVPPVGRAVGRGSPRQGSWGRASALRAVRHHRRHS